MQQIKIKPISETKTRFAEIESNGNKYFATLIFQDDFKFSDLIIADEDGTQLDDKSEAYKNICFAIATSRISLYSDWSNV